MSEIPFKAINSAALDRIESLVRDWFPEGNRQGDEYVTKNPHREDRKAGSFSINVKKGVWKDFGSDDAGSDLVALYAFRFHLSMKDAALELGRELGIIPERPSSASRKATTPRPVPPVPPTAPAPPTPKSGRGKPTAEYIYRNQAGEVIQKVHRFDPPGQKKYFIPSIFKDGRWVNEHPAAPRPLYGLDRLVDPNKATVLVVEGEKTADAAAIMFPAMAVVTSSGGADSALQANWAPLQGRHVVIFPDHDSAGTKYAGDVVAQLKALGVTACVVEIPKAWPEKWDLADQPPAGVMPSHLQDMIQQAQPWEGAAAVPGGAPEPLRIVDTSEWGIRTPPPLTWLLDGLIPEKQPGILGGRSNAGKSLLAIEIGQALAIGSGILGLRGPGAPRFSVYVSMEDGEEELERRDNRGLDLLKEDHPDWSPGHLQLVRQNFIPLVPEWAAPGAKTLGYLVEQIERIFQLQRPPDVPPGLILLDTLAAVAEGEENKAESQQALWSACHHLTKATGATVLLLHHSKKPMGTKPPPMGERMSFDFIRGSSAIVAGARFVIQMEPLTREEAEKLGLDGDRAAAGNFPVLALSKQVSGPKGDWILLEQRQAHEVGGGFFTPHQDSERLVAQLKSKGATKKLNLLESILVDVHRGLHDRKELARRNYPDLAPDEGEAKLTQALKDMRRKTRGWIQAGGMDLTSTGFLKAQALCLAEDIKTGSASTASSTHEDDGSSNDAA